MGAPGIIRVAVLPPPSPLNPYQALLHEALRDYGVRVVSGSMKPFWALRAPRHADAVHLHWPEYLMVRDGPRLRRVLASWAATALLLMSVEILRRRRVAVVWTVHNARPHSTVTPRMHRLLYRRLARRATAVIAHTRHAADYVRRELGRTEEVVIAPHGNYIGAYPAPHARSATRARLGLPREAFVYLAFGQIRRYKQLPALVEAFREFSDPAARLVIAGSPLDAAEAARLQELAQDDERIVLELGFVPDDAITSLHVASDAAVFHYAELFSSGAVMLALPCGLPVVAPDRGFAEEIAGGEALGPYGEGQLLAALAAVQRGDAESRREAALRAAEAFPWSLAAEAHARAYGAAF